MSPVAITVHLHLSDATYEYPLLYYYLHFLAFSRLYLSTPMLIQFYPDASDLMSSC